MSPDIVALLIILIVPAIMVPALILLGSLAMLNRLREAHHGYWGLAWTLLWLWLWWPLAVLGWLVLVDDALQHYLQLFREGCRSPLYRLYGLAYSRWAWLRALNRWADERMGRRDG